MLTSCAPHKYRSEIVTNLKSYFCEYVIIMALSNRLIFIIHCARWENLRTLIDYKYIGIVSGLSRPSELIFTYQRVLISLNKLINRHSFGY